jgi:hypothetical protein
MVCTNNLCGTAACQMAGQSCTQVSDCCFPAAGTPTCTNGICGSSNCQLTGSPCTSPSGCCSNICNGGLCG